MTPANVASSDPVNLLFDFHKIIISKIILVYLEVLGQVILPREEIIVTRELCVFDSVIE